MYSARGNSRKFRFQSENRKRELDLPQDKKHDLQFNLRKISNRRRPNLITKGFYLQCRKKMVCTYHGQIKRATKKFDYGRQAQSKLQLSWTGLLYPQLIHHISISNLPDKQWLPHQINNGILPDNQWQPQKVTQNDLVNCR